MAVELPTPRLHLDVDRPVWFFSIGPNKNMAYFAIESYPSVSTVQLSLILATWNTIKFSFDMNHIKDITVGMMRNSLIESYPYLAYLGPFVLLDVSKTEVLADSEPMSSFFDSSLKQSAQLWLINTINQGENMPYKELVFFQLTLPTGHQIQYYVWADVECKCSDLLQPAQRMLSLMALSSGATYAVNVQPKQAADADKPIYMAISQAWSGSGTKPKRFDLHGVVPLTVSQVTQVDEQMLKTLKSIQAIKDFKLIPTDFRLWNQRCPYPADPSVLALVIHGDNIKGTALSVCKTEMETNDSSTPEVAQGKYFLHAILLKNQDVVETVILKGEGFKTITEPEKNYKYWSNRHGEQDGPLTDAISKAFALVYELRTSNDD